MPRTARKLLVPLALALGFSAPLAADTLSGHDGAPAMTDVRVTDFSGRPPFKRRTERLPVMDVAQLETAEMVTVRATDFSGRPPFRRGVETLRLVETAQLEIAADDALESRTHFSGRVPRR